MISSIIKGLGLGFALLLGLLFLIGGFTLVKYAVITIAMIVLSIILTAMFKE